jgi:hypothetical protein
VRLALLTLAGVLTGCGGDAPPAPSAPAWFVESAAERGLAFTHATGHREGVYWIPETIAGGAALFDREDDGDLDAYLVQGGALHAGDPAPGDQLFENDGTGHFRDVTAASGTGDARYGMGVTAGDMDGDGDADLFVTNLGRNTWYVNRGDGSFDDRSEAGGFTLEGLSTGAVLFDLDRDGALDLFVARYMDWSEELERVCAQKDYCGPLAYKAPARSLLYANRGAGRFQDISIASGVWHEPGTGLGVASGDFDGDGWADVFVANDSMPNHLWRNRGDGRFENTAMQSGCGVDANGVAKAGMGLLAADFDDDLDLDLFVCNLTGESDSYYRNEGRYFSDRTALLGLAVPSKGFTRFGLAFGDFDQDGRADLYVANGRIQRGRGQVPVPDLYAEPNLLLAGVEGGRFAEREPRGGTEPVLWASSRAAVQGDLDGDGALDLLIVNRGGPAHLLLNRVPERGRGALFLVRETSGAAALGARLELEVGAKKLRRDVAVAYGYNSSHDPRVHVGLGNAERVERVRVTWTDGTSESFGPFAAGGVHELRRGAGQR